jgi:hypothetical protein
VTAEYLEWGKVQGGHKGRPWSASHLFAKTSDLTHLAEVLGLKVLADLDNVLPRVEKLIPTMAQAGKAE